MLAGYLVFLFPVGKLVFSLPTLRKYLAFIRRLADHCYRSSLTQIFFKIDVLKNLANFTGKYLCWILFLIKLQAWRTKTFLKRDSNTVVFLWNFPNCLEHLFYRAPPVASLKFNFIKVNKTKQCVEKKNTSIFITKN